MISKAFKALCFLQGASLIVMSVTGMAFPRLAMSDLAPGHQDWNAATAALLKMQAGGDFAVGVGYLISALFPLTALTSFAASVTASLLHGLVHLELLSAHHCSSDARLVLFLIGLPLLLSALFPWRQALWEFQGAEVQDSGKYRRSAFLFGVSGFLFLAFGLGDLFGSGSTLNLLSSFPRSWQPTSLSLMKMHGASDVGVGIGLMLCGWRPSRALGGAVVALISLTAHLIAHLTTLETLPWSHPMAHPLYLFGVVLLLALLGTLTPWKDSMKALREKQPGRNGASTA